MYQEDKIRKIMQKIYRNILKFSMRNAEKVMLANKEQKYEFLVKMNVDKYTAVES